MASEKQRWAIIGNGFARHTVLPCLALVPEVRVVALCARNAERARETAQRWGIPEVFADYRDMIRQTRPDLVVVTAPPHLHAEMSIFALEQGCHVLCEKPMALDASEAARMVEAARRAPGQLNLLDHELRFDPARRRIGALVAEGWLGRVRQVAWTQRSGSQASPEKPFSWWHEAAKGGGLLGALGSHAVDLFRFWGLEAEAAFGLLRTQIPERPDPRTGKLRRVETDDAFVALLRLAGGDRVEPGALARIDMNAASPGPWVSRIEILGSKGRLLLDETGTLWGCREGEDSWEALPVKEELPKTERQKIPDTVWARAFLRYARAVAEVLAKHRALVPEAAEFQDGLRVQEVLDAVRASHASGRWVSVDRREVQD
jgi:predicted dehydrogenase